MKKSIRPKTNRFMKVHKTLRSTSYSYTQPTTYKDVPTITLSGLWLEQCGFNINDEIIVNVQDNKLIISKA